MTVLSKYFASQAFDRVKSGLTPARQRGVGAIIEMLDTDGTVSVAILHSALFPLNTTTSANSQLNRLIAAVNRAAGEAGTSLRIAISADKKLGKARRVWFEGDTPDPPKAITAELNATSGVLIDQTRGTIAGPCVVLLTFNEHEREELLSCFDDLEPRIRRRIDDVEYRHLGELHGTALIHRHSHDQGQLAAFTVTDEAIRHWSPGVVIAVGIAMGLHDAPAQEIGHVLVSKAVHNFESARLNEDGTRTARGYGQAVFPKLLDRFRDVDDIASKADSAWPHIHVGHILCGNAVVDNQQWRVELQDSPPRSIGYDMESYGIAEGAARAETHWIVIKGVSDWGDGRKGEHKDKNQKLAARKAATVVRRVLEHGNLPGSHGTRTALFTNDKPKSPPRVQLMSSPEADDLLAHGTFIESARGTPASMEKEQAPAQGSGVPVMDYLMEWIDNPSGPSLFALLGEYGMGKTVTCQRLAQSLDSKRQEDPTRPLPLYFDLRYITDLDKRVPNLPEILADCIGRGWSHGSSAQQYTLDDVFDYMDRGAVVIFDGLDEILVKLREHDGSIFTQTLLKLLADYELRDTAVAPARILISCRTQYFRTLSHQRNHFTGEERGEVKADSFRTMVLLPLSDEQVEEYLLKFFPDAALDKLMDLIKSVHNLTELSKRPFTLRLISEFIPELEVDRKSGRPVYGVSLYRKVAQRWLDRDQGKHHIRPEDKMQLAAHLAAYLWRQGTSLMEAKLIEDWFHEWLNEQPALSARYRSLHPEQLEEDLRTATFLSRDDNGENSGFRFAHTSLQEFFLADYMLDAIRNDRPDLWAMQIPSVETLDFLGQMMEEADSDRRLMTTLQSWRKTYRKCVSELLLAYAIHAAGKGWPTPVLDGIDLTGADLRGFRFDGSARRQLDLRNAIFRQANLRGCRFNDVRLNNADFGNSRLEQATFQSCDLSNTVFEGGDMTAAIFRQSLMTNSLLSGARGYRTRFLNCENVSKPLALEQPTVSSIRVKPRPSAVSLYWRTGHEGWITACAFSPDGARLLSAGYDGTLRLWDAESLEEIRTMTGHEDWIHACAFSPDGARLLSAGYDRTLRLWDAESGEEIRNMTGHEDEISACAFSPDGARLLSAGYDHTLRLWDADRGEEIRAMTEHADWIHACAFSPDGARLLSAGADATLRLWETDSGEEVRTMTGHENWITACAFSPDGARLLSAGDDGTLRLWEADSGEEIRTMTGHEGVTSACAFSPDGAHLLSAGDYGTLRLWEADSGEVVRTMAGHEGEISGCAFSPDGARLLSAGDDGTLRLWEADSGEEIRTMTGHEGQIASCAFMSDGARLLSAGYDRTLRLWDADGGEGSRTMTENENRTLASTFRRDGTWLLSIGSDGTLRLWDADSGEEVRTMTGHKGRIVACAFNPDGTRVLSAEEDGRLRLWDAESGKEIRTMAGHKGWVLACAFNSDSTRLLSAGGDSTLRLWEADSGEEVRTMTGHKGRIGACAFSPDGVRLLSAGDDGTLRLWDADSGEEIRTMMGHIGVISACAFSPDGTRLLSAGDDGTLRLWGAESGEAIRVHASLGNNGHAVWDVSDNRVISVKGDGWRYLSWRDSTKSGIDAILPLETYWSPPADSPAN